MSKAKYLAFYENWRMNKKWCTPEEWYELEDLILQLRFDGIDTKVEDIKNPKLQMIWNNIRPSLLKSNRDKKYNDNKKSALQEVKETEFDTPKQEIENKPILSPSKPLDDNLYHPDKESASNGLKVGKNEVLDNEPKVLPNVKLVATAQTHSIPTFEEYLQDEKNNIENIIKDFNAGGTRATLQAPENLKDLLNRKWGRYYKEQITEYINNRRVA